MEGTSRPPRPVSARFVSGVHTGLIHGTAGSHYRRQAHDPPPNTALASALGPPWEGPGLPLSTLR